MSDEEHRRKVVKELQFRKFLEKHVPAEQTTLLDFGALYRTAHKSSERFRNAEPFPHIVIDEFLPKESFEKVHEAIPRIDEPVPWTNLNVNLDDGRPAQAEKFHLMNVLFMRPVLRQLMFELNSGAFMTFLGRLTGAAIISDPLLQGGGVHLVKRGGLLRVHADFSKHATYRLDRHLNLLLYCNVGWQEDWGGHLELWDESMTRCEKRILPIANRCVIFNTSTTSYHGHPHPLTCPDGVMRTTIASYYYRGNDGHENRVEHETLWQDLPEETDHPE